MKKDMTLRFRDRIFQCVSDPETIMRSLTIGFCELRILISWPMYAAFLLVPETLFLDSTSTLTLTAELDIISSSPR